MMTYTNKDVLKILKAAVVKAGGATAWAKKHRISGPYVSLCLNGAQTIGPKVARALGFTKVVAFVKKA